MTRTEKTVYRLVSIKTGKPYRFYRESNEGRDFCGSETVSIVSGGVRYGVVQCRRAHPEVGLGLVKSWQKGCRLVEQTWPHELAVRPDDVSCDMLESRFGERGMLAVHVEDAFIGFWFEPKLRWTMWNHRHQHISLWFKTDKDAILAKMLIPEAVYNQDARIE